MSRFLFTSESVTEGHPDKMADQISDGILDAIIAKDPNARVACETALTTGMVLLMGEITTNAQVDLTKVTRNIIKDIGYTDADYGLDYKSCAVLSALDEQSPDIALGVNNPLENKNYNEEHSCGAGDQGMMFGYACNETPELMPIGISFAHKLTKRLAEVRKNGTLPYLRPDGKSQVTVDYRDGKPRKINTIVISTQHSPEVSLEQIFDDVVKHVIIPAAPKGIVDDTRILINPTGRFVVGGPQGDSGLTGRKIIVDTYGGYGRHGGGAFSGKDPTKVDRTAAYAGRYIAKNIVAAGLAEKCEVQLAYAIGVANPVSVNINTFATGKVEEDRLVKAVRELFDLTPEGMIKSLDLRKPIYRPLAAYGHMGREDLLVKWEQTDKAEEILKLVK